MNFQVKIQMDVFDEISKNIQKPLGFNVNHTTEYIVISKLASPILAPLNNTFDFNFTDSKNE